MLTKLFCFILVLTFIGKGQLQAREIRALFNDLFAADEPNVAAVVKTLFPLNVTDIVVTLFGQAERRILIIINEGNDMVGRGEPIRKLSLKTAVATADHSGRVGRRKLVGRFFNALSELLFGGPATEESIVKDAIEGLLALLTEMEERILPIVQPTFGARAEFDAGSLSRDDFRDLLDDADIKIRALADEIRERSAAMQVESLERLEAL